MPNLHCSSGSRIRRRRRRSADLLLHFALCVCVRARRELFNWIELAQTTGPKRHHRMHKRCSLNCDFMSVGRRRQRRAKRACVGHFCAGQSARTRHSYAYAYARLPPEGRGQRHKKRTPIERLPRPRTSSAHNAVRHSN